MSIKRETVPCTYCGRDTPMTGTKLCDYCWQVSGCMPTLGLPTVMKIVKSVFGDNAVEEHNRVTKLS